ncbi:MAG: hypothetical protein Kow0059_01830 [Candidatus Sumerlaeia bacterium]
MDTSAPEVQPRDDTRVRQAAGYLIARWTAALILILCPFASVRADYDCFYTSSTLIVDGLLNEPAWEIAPVITFMLPVTHDAPQSRTEGRLVWTDERLYIVMKAWDEDLCGEMTERDSSTWKDDVLETFLRPLPGEPVYYNFEINVLATVYDAENRQPDTPPSVSLGPAPRRRVNSREEWNCAGLEHAVQCAGTINNFQDRDQFWVLEMSIPFKSLPILNGRPPAPGDIWEFLLARYDYSTYLPQGKELSSCAPLRAVNFHALDDYINLRFIK